MSNAADPVHRDPRRARGLLPCRRPAEEQRARALQLARVGFILGFGSDELFLGAHTAVTLDRSGGLVGGQREILIKTVSNVAGGIHAPEDDIVRVIAPRGHRHRPSYNGAGMTGPAILSKTRFDDTISTTNGPNGGDGPMFKYERIYVLTQTINPATRVIRSRIVPENPKIPQDSTSPPGVNVTILAQTRKTTAGTGSSRSGRDADDYSGLINVRHRGRSGRWKRSVQHPDAQHIDIGRGCARHLPGILSESLTTTSGLAARAAQCAHLFSAGQKGRAHFRGTSISSIKAIPGSLPHHRR